MILEPNDLRTLTLQACRLDSVRKSDLHCGDCVIVTTRNSVYTIFCLGDDQYSVSGGWFDRAGVSPTTISINGCTWGGSAIHSEIVAARGLFLEFGNQVVTTRIQNVRILRASKQTIN